MAMAAAAAALKEATKSLAEGWRIIPRPILETILNNYAHHHRVHQPVIFHGPRGVGKTSLLLHRLLPEWNKGAHVTAYVDFAGDPFATRPWASFSTALEPPSLGAIRGRLESELEALVDQGVRRGSIGSRDVFDALNKWHGLHTALKRIIGPNCLSKRDETASVSALWSKAMFTFSSRIGSEEINVNLATEEKAISAGGTRKYSMGEVAHMREAAVSIKLAKEVIKMHQEWRREAVRDLNRKGGFSRSLANSSTDWPSLLLDILSSAAEIDFFQPKLVINNVDVLRKAILTDDSTVSATMFHDSFIWRLIALGVNERCLPVVLVTSDRAYQGDKSNFEDIVDAYLSYLQVTVVNPAMESALLIVQKFAFDAYNGKVYEDRLRFGAPWRHPPRTNDPVSSIMWAKIQLIDFVQSFLITEFGVLNAAWDADIPVSSENVLPYTKILNDRLRSNCTIQTWQG